MILIGTTVQNKIFFPQKIPLNLNDYPIWSEFEEEMLLAFNQALLKTNLYVYCFNICGKIIKLCFAGPALIKAVTSALNHHAVLEQESSPDFTIYIWDCDSTNTSTPDFKLNRATKFNDPQGNWRVAAERLPRYLTAANRKHGFLWANSIVDYPIDRYATPLRTTLLWWFAGYGFHGLHAAAVGWKGKGALLIGNKGTGKSTSSLLCLQEGFDYLGDDIVLFNFQKKTFVHSLYNTTKINAADKISLTTTAVAKEGGDRQREVHSLYPSYQKNLNLSLLIHALIVLNISEKDKTEFQTISSGSAFTILAPSTHKTLSIAIGTQAVSLSAIAQLARLVPSYLMNLGKNADTTIAAIRSILEGQ